MMTMKKISILIPAYNEQEVLEHLYQRLGTLANDNKKYQFEFLFVNDGSRDKTIGIIKEYAESDDRVAYVDLSRNFGKEAALSAGIDHARGNAVLLIDADFQHPLEMLGEMHALWQSGYEMVYGVIADRGTESGAKRMGTNLFYSVMNSGSAVKLPPNAGDFRWMDRKVVDALQALPENNRFMKGLYAWVGFKTVALPFVPKDRAAGNSSFNLRRLGSLALLGLTSFTTLPLRIWSMVGAGISLLALTYGLWIAAEALFFGNPLRGWPTLAASIMLFSGVQLLSIGILGEYIGRIYEEVKRRPIYLIAHDEDRSPLREKP